jgi:hypothetical protein
MKTQLLNSVNYSKATVIVIVISFIIRAFAAYNIELGNDEAYYWLLASNPALSYFDHPPMFAWFINLFSFGLTFDSELFIRMSSLLVFSLNTWIVFSIGKEIKNKRTGFIAALLYQSSLYTFVITGIMIIPDTPLSLFWLLAMRSFLIAIARDTIEKRELKHILLGGLFTGLAVLSKYQTLIIWFGIGSFILLYRREWLKKPQFYLAGILTLLSFFPILLWNKENDWANLSFQTSRISFYGSINPIYFMRELLGQIVYNNPINVAVAAIAIISYHKKPFLKKYYWKTLLWLGIPLSLAFLFFSLFRPTLPHWSAPAYFSLMLISAAWIEQISKRVVPTVNIVAIALIVISLASVRLQINHGIFYDNKSEDPKKLGENDVTLDLYGWSQIEEQFMEVSFPQHAETKTIIAKKWFNAAHLDYYLARPNKMKLIALGNANDIHEYLRVNNIRGNIQQGEDAWFIAVSRNYIDPYTYYSNNFETIQPLDTLNIYRNNKVVEYAFVFYMKNYHK